MSIELHCEHCGKLIRAPENSGGKRGKCPYCHQSVYIPTPPDDLEAIPLAPEDEDENQEELARESADYAALLSRATPQPGKVDLADQPGGAAGAAIPEDIDIEADVEQYIIAMSNSKLDRAEAIVKRLKSVRRRASDYVQSLLLDEMPPEIGNVPPPVLKGFLKTLSGQLDEK